MKAYIFGTVTNFIGSIALFSAYPFVMNPGILCLIAGIASAVDLKESFDESFDMKTYKFGMVTNFIGFIALFCADPYSMDNTATRHPGILCLIAGIASVIKLKLDE